MAVKRRLLIDPVACDAFGHCAELAPSIISLDEWGYPVVENQQPSDQDLVDVKRAVHVCPRKALRLQQITTKE